MNTKGKDKCPFLCIFLAAPAYRLEWQGVWIERPDMASLYARTRLTSHNGLLGQVNKDVTIFRSSQSVITLEWVKRRGACVCLLHQWVCGSVFGVFGRVWMSPVLQSCLSLAFFHLYICFWLFPCLSLQMSLLCVLLVIFLSFSSFFCSSISLLF